MRICGGALKKPWPPSARCCRHRPCRHPSMMRAATFARSRNRACRSWWAHMHGSTRHNRDCSAQRIWQASHDHRVEVVPMHQILNTLYITTEPSYAHLDHDTLRVEVNGETKLQVPLQHL